MTLQATWFVGVLLAFAIFGLVLYWAERRTREANDQQEVSPRKNKKATKNLDQAKAKASLQVRIPGVEFFVPVEGPDNGSAHDLDAAPPHIKFNADDMPPFLLAVFCQCLLVWILFVFAGFLPRILGFPLVAGTAVLCGLLDCGLYRVIISGRCAYLGLHQTRDPERNETIINTPPGQINLLFYVFWGVLSQFFILVLCFKRVVLGTRWDQIETFFWGSVTLIVLSGAAFLIGRVEYLSLKRGRAPWLIFGTTLVAIPLFFAWGGPYQLTANNAISEFETSELQISREYRAKVLTDRENLRRCSDGAEWQISDRTMDVAVTLSGGGYRAALIHAGLLAFLDERCVPIHYLSTVSGGSIIGGYYALGYRPEDFARLLWHTKPGLPFQMFSTISQVANSLTAPSYSADVYSAHFSKTYFGGATLADLPDRPVLIANATDPETDPLNSREIFFREKAAYLQRPDGRRLDRLIKIADVVAASGAFPGAFEPKHILWGVNNETIVSDVRDRRFVDGGVLENVGVQGLIQYLEMMRPVGVEQPRHPHVLIISDASKRSGKRDYSPKIGILNVVERAQDISFSGLHSYLYSTITNRANFWSWLRSEPIETQLSKVPWRQLDRRAFYGGPNELTTIVVPTTAPEIRDHMAGLRTCTFNGEPIERVQQQVGAYATLDELEWDQVEKAFWLGYTMGHLYWPAISCARSRASNANASCSSSLGTNERTDQNLLVRRQCPTFAKIRNSLSRPSKGRDSITAPPPWLTSN